MRIKTISLALLVVLLLCVFAFPVFADGLYEIMEEHTGSVGDKIMVGENQGEGEILSKVEEQVSNIVVTVRVIAAIAAVIFIIWIGIVFFTSGGNPMRLAQAKSQVALFFVSLICIFAAEPIVRFVLSWFVNFNP